MGREPPSLLEKRATLTDQLRKSPYNPEIYLERALCHELLGFPDLAVGDAYKALLLTDEVSDDSGEYHGATVEAISKANHIPDGGEHSGSETRDDTAGPDATSIHSDGKPVRKHSGGEIEKSLIEDIARYSARRAFVVLTRTLSSCGCLRSAFDFSETGLRAFPNYLRLQQLQDKLVDTWKRDQQRKETAYDLSAFDPRKDLPENGFVRRELYPWNMHEPDRFSPSSLSSLNISMRRVAPKCEVRTVSLPLLTEESLDQRAKIGAQTVVQLGIFATEDIAPHETVLRESSLLAANNRLHEPLCDCCSGPLPSLSVSDESLPTCPSCDDTVFCSHACSLAAQSFYHPAVCGKPDFDILAKDPSRAAASNALYLLLLARTFALSETQQIHPLELAETKYLWGDFVPSGATDLHSASASTSSASRNLPFTFHDNIVGPLHVLEKMDVNIFTSFGKYDTWVLNTLYAKFRATASARLSTKDGGPEVCAVHPMWCLANHSCAPNVQWEWAGEIRFVARGEDEVAKWQGMGGREWGKGIKKGEEILNHYCDVDLGMKERREWAAGALGGICLCERCFWEEQEERKQGKGGKDRD
jgi:hypothetical protein